MDKITNTNKASSVRLKYTGPRTTSNGNFGEKFRQSMGTGAHMMSAAVRQGLRPIPGSAALSASISDAAASLNAPSSLGGVSAALSGGGGGDSEMDSLQEQLFKNNNDMLDKQLQVSQYTTTVTVRSSLIKALTDAGKAVGNNMR